MAGINFKDGPGGRMKRAQQAQVLYVKSANDPRLKAFQDSTSLYNAGLNRANSISQQAIQNDAKMGIKSDRDLTVDYNKYAVYDSKPSYANSPEDVPSTYNFYKNTLKDNSYNYNPKSKIKPIANIGWDGRDFNRTAVYKKPERTVILNPSRAMPPVEQMSPRQAMPPEIVAPAMRPMPQMVPVEQVAPLMEEAPVAPQEAAPAPVRRGPKAIMPTRQGGWSNQPLLMRLFPKLYAR